MNPRFEKIFQEHKRARIHTVCPVCELYAAIVAYDADEEAYLTLIAQLEDGMREIQDLCRSVQASATLGQIEAITTAAIRRTQ